MLMVDVPAFTVMLVADPGMFQVVVVEDANVQVPLPIDSVLVNDPVLEKPPAETLLLFASIVPAVSIKVLVDVSDRLPINCQLPPAPLRVTLAANVVLLVVMVLPAAVELKVIVPVAFQTVPEDSDMLPDTVGVPVDVNVTVPADTVKLRQVSAPVSVTV